MNTRLTLLADQINDHHNAAQEYARNAVKRALECGEASIHLNKNPTSRFIGSLLIGNP